MAERSKLPIQRDEDQDAVTCPTCDGEGHTTFYWENTPTRPLLETNTFWRCHGSGQITRAKMNEYQEEMRQIRKLQRDSEPSLWPKLLFAVIAFSLVLGFCIFVAVNFHPAGR
jgi:hypothetical protein